MGGSYCVAAILITVGRAFVDGESIFTSGQAKIANWDSTIFLFTHEYKVPILPPDIAAYMATAGELCLPVLLVLGLLTPLGALGLFCMTLVIELFVYPGTTEHYYWFLLLGLIATHGGGKFSIDSWLYNRQEQ